MMETALIVVLLLCFGGKWYGIALRARAEAPVPYASHAPQGSTGWGADRQALLERSRRWELGASVVLGILCAGVLVTQIAAAAQGRASWLSVLGFTLLCGAALMIRSSAVRESERLPRSAAEYLGVFLRSVRNRLALLVAAAGMVLLLIG
jgi:hypothetical protein